jgi:hypothetical protein
MTAPRDPDRLIHAFLTEGQTELADPVYDTVRDRIEMTRQRAVIGPWRTPIMNKFVAIGLGAAAVVVIALIAFNLLPGSPAPGGEPSATPEPTVAEPSPSAESGLPVGSSHVLLQPGVETPVGITVTVPAPGWAGDVGVGFLEKGENGADPPDGAGVIVFEGPLYVYGDPCQWSTTTPDTASTTVDEVVAALAAQASRDASAPVDVTVDGYSGKSITLHVPDDAVFGECDGGYFGSWAGGGDPVSAGPSRYHQGPGQIDQVWVLDVDGTLVTIDAAWYEVTPAEDRAELDAILDSFTFELP